MVFKLYQLTHILAKMQPHSTTMGVVARELALDIASASHSPDIVRHIPGIANVAADALSRQAEPGSDKKIPAYLPKECQAQAPARNPAYWRSRQQL